MSYSEKVVRAMIDEAYRLLALNGGYATAQSGREFARWLIAHEATQDDRDEYRRRCAVMEEARAV